MHKSAATATSSVVSNSTWYPNSGTITHMTNVSTQFVNSHPYPGSSKVVIGNGCSIPILRVRNFMLSTRPDPLFLKDLVYVLDIHKNLLVSKLSKHNYVFFNSI